MISKTLFDGCKTPFSDDLVSNIFYFIQTLKNVTFPAKTIMTALTYCINNN